jgi:hypothetical protein
LDAVLDAVFGRGFGKTGNVAEKAKHRRRQACESGKEKREGKTSLLNREVAPPVNGLLLA